MSTHFRKFRTLTILVVMALYVIFNLNAVLGQTTLPVVLDTAWSPDGEMLATIEDNGTLNVILPSQNTIIFQVPQPITLVDAVVEWNLQGDYLAVGIGNKVYIFITENWELTDQFIGGDPNGVITDYTTQISEGIANIRWSLDSRYVVTGSLSYITTVWDQEDARILYQEVDTSSGGPGRVWLSDDGWVGNGTSKLNVFTGENFRPNRSENPSVFFASAEGASTEPRPDNTHIAWGTVHGLLTIINLDTLTLVQGIQVRYNPDPYSQLLGIADISWDRTWNFIAVASRDGELYVVNLVTSEVTTILNVDGRLNAVDWNPTSNEITYAGVTNSGEPILESVNVSGIGGVPVETSIFTPLPSNTSTPTETTSLIPTETIRPTSTTRGTRRLGHVPLRV